MERTNRDILKRIVALLFALADLADRASLAPRPICVLVLCVLRPAEAVAQAFVFGLARDLGVALPPRTSLNGDDTDDATRLALRLRVLALTLASLLAWAGSPAGHGSGRIVAVAAIEVLQKLCQLAGCRREGALRPDTS